MLPNTSVSNMNPSSHRHPPRPFNSFTVQHVSQLPDAGSSPTATMKYTTRQQLRPAPSSQYEGRRPKDLRAWTFPLISL